MGKSENDNYWKSIIRQATVQGYLTKDIETYGVLNFLRKLKFPFWKKTPEFMIAEDREYDLANDCRCRTSSNKLEVVLTKNLFAQLKELRKKKK